MEKIKQTISCLLIIFIIMIFMPLNSYAQLGAIGEFIGIGETEERNLGAVRTMSGNVMQKGSTGVGFIYQYLRFVAFDGHDLATAFKNEGEYDFRKYEYGKSYFISHGTTDKLTFSVFVNEFYIEESYFTWDDLDKDGVVDKKTDTVENFKNSYTDLSQVWLQGTYQLMKRSDDHKLSVSGILRMPTGYERAISNDSLGLYFGASFTKKIFKNAYLMGDMGYNHYEMATYVANGNLYNFYPGDSMNAHLAVVHPITKRFTYGGEISSSYHFKPSTEEGTEFGNETSTVDLSPVVKFKINKKTVFYTSVSYKLYDNLTWGYDYGYIFGVNYLFE